MGVSNVCKPKRESVNYLATNLSDLMIVHTARTGKYVLCPKLVSIEELKRSSEISSLVSIVKFKNVVKFLKELGISINQSSSESIKLRIDVRPGDTLYVISPIDGAAFFRSMNEYNLSIPSTTKVQVMQYRWIEATEDELRKVKEEGG